jgi:hypothetical protein
VGGEVRCREQGSSQDVDFYFPKKPRETVTPHTQGRVKTQSKQQDETDRKNKYHKIITHHKQKNKPAQKPAGLLGLNSPQSKPKHQTGATNQTQLNETEKGIGGS